MDGPHEILVIGTDDAIKFIFTHIKHVEGKVDALMANVFELRDAQAALEAALDGLKVAAETAADRVDAKIQELIDAQVKQEDLDAIADSMDTINAISDIVAGIGEDAPEEPPVEEPPVEEPPVEEPPVEEPPVEEPPVEEPPVEEPPVEEPPGEPVPEAPPENL